MEKQIFAVYDAPANVFSNPFVTVNSNTALRDFRRGVNDPATAINSNPEDFSLYRLGSLDDNTGIITPASPPELICQAINLVERSCPSC